MRSHSPRGGSTPDGDEARAPLTFGLADPGSPDAQSVLSRFFTDIVARRRGRPPTPAELARVMLDEPSSDLRGATGFLVVVRDGAQVVGCGGVRIVEPGVGELTRIFVDPVARGRRGGHALLRELEATGAHRGLHLLRLTVRDDLVEARRLYESAGYRPVAPFSDSPYADHFLAKALGSPPQESGAHRG
ncbi:GNAT family N-acetyltransferase [Microbacterium sp. P06]|uniref:GNAT family N-acetyltransferase n=1 Tax=Microbacterium sp. P06 TaxID=3366949 RepID=UPI003747167E